VQCQAQLICLFKEIGRTEKRKKGTRIDSHLVDNGVRKGAVGMQTGQTRFEDSSMKVEPAEVAEVKEEEQRPTQFRM
jgi:hypothetical protein